MFITFEGGEGVGKSTQARLLTERLRAAGRKVVPVHEPGGTPLGEYIRNWVKAKSAPLTPTAELLLFTASRAELVRRVIRPSLNDGAAPLVMYQPTATRTRPPCTTPATLVRTSPRGLR